MPGASAVLRSAAASARQRSGRVALTAVALALAVSFAVAAFGVAAHLERLVGSAAPATRLEELVAEGTVVITAQDAGATEPTALSEELVRRAGSVEGVLAAAGTYEQPIAARIERGSQDERPPMFRGLLFSSAWDPARWELRRGSAPDRVGAGSDRLPVAMDAGGLRTAAVDVGGTLELQTPTGGVAAVVVGEVAAVGAATPSGEPGGIADAHVVIPPDVIAEVLGARGRVDRITVTPEPGTSTGELTDRLTAALPEGLRFASALDADVVRARAVSAASGAIVTATTGFAAVAALVAGLLVINTLSIVAAQRRSEIALARCVGMTRRQAMASFLTETAAIGVVASFAGLVAGIPLATLGAGVLQPDSRPELLVTPAMVAVAVLVGVGVTLLAAVAPARSVGRVAPVAALDASRGRRGSRRRGVIGSLSSVTSALAGRLGARPTVRMALGRPGQDPRTARAVVSTLVVSLALIAAVLTASTSLSDAIDDQYATSSTAELYLRRRGVVRVDARSLEQQLGVDRSRVGYVDVVAVEGVLEGPSGTEPVVHSAPLVSVAWVFPRDLRPADGASPAPGGVLVSEAAASGLGVGAGDSVTLRTTSGDEAELVVGGTYRNTAVVGAALVDHATARAVGAEGSVDLVGLDLPAGAPTDRIAEVVDRRLAGFNRLGVDTPEGFAATDTDIATTVTRLVLVLASGTLLLGGFGAANAIALSVMERRREFALMRTIGATAGQVRRMVTVEAAVLSGLAGVLGVVGGAAVALVGQGFAPSGLPVRPAVPWWALLAVALGAVLTGALAATLPAARAARRGMLEDLDRL